MRDKRQDTKHRVGRVIPSLAAQIKFDTGVVPDPLELETVINDIRLAYDGARYWNDDDKRFPHSLAKARVALRQTVALLSDASNQERLCRSDAEIDCMDRLLGQLSALRDRAQTLLNDEAEAKRKNKGKKGKRSRRRDEVFFDAIKGLLEYWTDRLKLEFTSDWQKATDGRDAGKWMPVTPAARFVYGAISFIDRKRLPKVRDALRRIKAGE